MVRRDLSTQQRNKIVQFILEGCNDVRPARGKMKEAMVKFSISRQNIFRLWKSAKKQRDEGQAIHIRSGKLTYTRKKIVHLDLTLLTSLDLSKRGTVRGMAKGLGKSKTNVGRWVLAGEIRAHTSAIKPDLTTPNKVVPDIISKWPPSASKEINIQQDNARPHISDNDKEFRAAASQSGFNIRLVQQPPNSPDCNVNDLGWFRAIQSLQVETSAKTVEELINAVIQSFHMLDATTLNNVFLSLQGCMVEIMKIKGQNCYKIPHMGKGALIRSDLLPLNLEVPMELVIQCLNHLKEVGCNEGVQEIMHIIGL